jgi:hypothetical protein
MQDDEFFSKVDSKLLKTAVETSETEKVNAENREFLEEVIVRLNPIAESYEAKLKERNIRTEVKSYPGGISFGLKYKDGGHRTLTIGGYQESNRIEFKTHFTNDDGKNYVSTSGKTYQKSDWQDLIYVEELQKCIDEFLYYQNRHGG